VAANYLAHAIVATIAGYGNQNWISLRTLATVKHALFVNLVSP
jgi:hypothetical protein